MNDIEKIKTINKLYNEKEELEKQLMFLDNQITKIRRECNCVPVYLDAKNVMMKCLICGKLINTKNKKIYEKNKRLIYAENIWNNKNLSDLNTSYKIIKDIFEYTILANKDKSVEEIVACINSILIKYNNDDELGINAFKV